ncbi:zinc-dependent metalloprotease [Sanguibacter sp. A247]|uniref:zinc-dependent metalloprotease n=1 Tax=unclassified Sanguibacter TaxID=2645534 RepID=UPI003FD75906
MTGSGPDARSSIDWDAARGVGALLAPAGPVEERSALVAHVDALRRAAAAAVPHVLDVTAMTPADGRDVLDGSTPLSHVFVVDRASWVRAASHGMESLLGASVLGPDDGGVARGTAGGPVVQAVGAAEVGAALALVATRVLGQFDPYVAAPGEPGRLLLVAPNVLRVGRALRAELEPFSLWVALHEQTHALQFAAAPWLADHMRARVAALLADVVEAGAELGRGGPAARARAWTTTVRRAVRAPAGSSLGVRLLTPSQRASMAEIAAVMSLLEGHADVMMDRVGENVVPGVGRIRTAFDARRASRGGALDTVLRQLLGLDEKLAQYTDGAAFVRGAMMRVGRRRLNAVWDHPDHLPSARELADPAAWVRRVHG